MPIFSFSTLCSFEHFHDAVGHAARHERHRAFGPLPGDRRDGCARFHPRQVDLGALQVGAGGLEQRRLAFDRHDGVADVDVVFPVALIRRGRRSGCWRRRSRTSAPRLSTFISACSFCEPLLAEAIEVDAVLPVSAGLAVQPARDRSGAACQGS